MLYWNISVKGEREMEKKKKLHLEFLRFLAILLVIFNHTGDAGYLYFTQTASQALYPLYFTLSVLCKVAVPLFWMVSGALLLDRDESVKYIFRHRFLRMAIVLTVFSFLYYLYSAKGNSAFTFSPVYFAERLYSSDLAPAFWYLYAYLGMLIMLPLLRKIAKGLSNAEFMYFFAAMLLLRGIVPVLEYALWRGRVTINTSFTANFFSYDVVFFLMGYFLEHRIPDDRLRRSSAWLLLLFGAVAVILIEGGTQLRLNDGGLMNDAQGEMFYAGLLFVPSAAVYYCARLIFRKVGEGSFVSRAVLLLGSVSFGVMLLEHFIRSETGFVLDALCAVLPRFSSAVIWTVLVYLIGGAAVWLLKRIPFVNKYI